MSEIVWLEIECDKSTCGNCKLCEYQSDNPGYPPTPHCWAFEVDLDRNKDDDPLRCGACVLNAAMKETRATEESSATGDSGLRAAVAFVRECVAVAMGEQKGGAE